MKIALYIIQSIYILLFLISLLTFSGIRCIGFLIVALLFGFSAILSFIISAFWPLIAGGLTALILLIIGTNVLDKWTSQRISTK